MIYDNHNEPVFNAGEFGISNWKFNFQFFGRGKVNFVWGDYFKTG